MATLTFETPPSHNQLRLAVQKLGLSSYRFTHTSQDRLTYEVEEVDVAASLREKDITPDDDTWTVPTKLLCKSCSAVYEGWTVLPKKWFDNKPLYQSTLYCPSCPPVSVDAWLSSSLIHTDRPITEYRTAKKSYKYKHKKRKEAELTMYVDLDDFQ